MSEGIMNILILLTYTDFVGILMLITKPGSFFQRETERKCVWKNKQYVILIMKNYDVK